MRIIAEWRVVPDPEHQFYFDIDSDPNFKYCCEDMKNAPTSGRFNEILWTNEISGQLVWKEEPITECPWCHEPIEIIKVGT